MGKKAADKKEETKAAPKAAKPKPKRGNAPIFMMGSMVMAIVFHPSTILLAIGMMPTVAVIFADPRRARTKAVTVGVLNLAGCVPFLLELWTGGHSIDRALNIASDPKAIIVMYAAAAMGYIIDWSMTAVVASILYQRGLSRQESIRKRQAELADRWGQEVTGEIPLDHYGFAVEQPEKTS